MSSAEVVQQVINALSLGSIYALVAIGLGVVFSIVRLINFAHGELLTITGYTLYLLGGRMPWGLAIVAAIACAAVAAFLMERVAFRPVRGAEPVTLLLTSFALSVILQSAFLVVFGGKAKSIPYPDWTSATFSVGTVRLAWLDIATFVLTILILLALRIFLTRSVIGIALRAAAEDFTVTRLMGVRANHVIVAAFILSGVLGGIAGLMWLASSAIVLPSSGFVPLLKGFIAAVVGGLGSLGGAALAGFCLGGLEVFFRNVLPGSISAFTDAAVFVFIIVLLLVKPAGLVTRTQRAV